MIKPFGQKRSKIYLGIFTELDIEEVFYEIPENIRNDLYLQNKPIGLGPTWREYLESPSKPANRGPLDFFCFLIANVYCAFEFAKILFEKSKKYNELNYYDGEHLKKHFIENEAYWVNFGIERHNDKNKYLKSYTNRYWVDYHFFMMVIIEFFERAERRIQVIEIVENYIPNYNKITEQMGIFYGWERPPTNGVMYTAIEFYLKGKDIEKVRFLSDLAMSRPNTWNISHVCSYEDEIDEI